MKRVLCSLGGVLALVLSTHASVFCNADFSTFSPGDLVGQESWIQFGTATALPLQVGGTGPQVLVPGGQNIDGQDAIRNFDFVSAPTEGTVSLYEGLALTVGSVPTGRISYWLTALQDTAAGFSNIRLAAQDQTANLGYYKLAARVTGQSGAPWAFGAYDLAYGSQHLVIIEANMVAGAQNDFIRMFVDPTSLDLASQTPYLVATVTVGGSETDPTGLGGLVISQYGTSTQASLDAAIGKAAVGNTFSEVASAIGVVPEPTVSALLGLALLTWSIRRRRR